MIDDEVVKKTQGGPMNGMRCKKEYTATQDIKVDVDSVIKKKKEIKIC